MHAPVRRAGHSAEERIEDAAEMAVVVVVRPPRAEQAMDREGIETELQGIAVPRDRIGEGRWPVGGIVRAEAIALPVQDPVAAVRLEDEVDEPAEITVPVRAREQPAIDRELAAYDVHDATRAIPGACEFGGQRELELA